MKQLNNDEDQKGFTTIVLVAIVVVMVAIVFSGIRVFSGDNNDVEIEAPNNTQNTDNTSEDQRDTKFTINDSDFLSYEHTATLEDVTDGETIEGVKFGGDTSGTAYATYREGDYKLYASFDNLPQIPEDLFYEGWIVGGAQGIVSTGELIVVNGKFINDFISDIDMTDSKRYVLTIEPRDDNPAPAPGHIVEGNFRSLDKVSS